MNGGPLAERVYDTLKARLLSGRMRPDEKLEPAVLAADLNSSVTPVRDALHRLCGERLVETRHSDGFHLPRVTEPALRDLYVWNAELLRTIMAAWRREARVSLVSDLPAEVDDATRVLFARFAGRSVNGEHVTQIDMASDRLSTARRAELAILPELGDELHALAIAFDHDGADLRKRLAAYHRRRIAAVPAIVRALYRP